MIHSIKKSTESACYAEGYTNGHTNGAETGTANTPSPLSGIFVPTVVFFKDDEDETLDLATLSSHIVRLADAGVAGIAVQGSNGEAVHLTREERNSITRTARDTLDSRGYNSLPVIVGCSAQSTQEAISMCKDAAIARGDYALVLPPSYYKGLFDNTTIEAYYTAVADASPIPLLIYNYPGAVSGLDLTSDQLIALGKHPNIAGCKFTCGNTGKLARVAAAFNKPKSDVADPGSVLSGGFSCLAGSGDFTLQSLAVGGTGIIGGIANIAPKVCVRVMKLFDAGDMKGAQAIQEILARGDWPAIQTGLVGTKVALQEYYGYGGWARKPLPRITGHQREELVATFTELVELEKSM